MFTLEESLHLSSGQPITIGPGAYKIPGFDDCPHEFNVYLLKGAENKRAIYSSKVNISERPFQI